jgi:hypothetical protein
LLVGGSTFSRHRVAYLLGVVIVFCLPAIGWYVVAKGEWVRWPSGSTEIGLTLGILAAAIIAFEMLIWPRKKFRRYRLGRTRTWMYWHIWLGLLSLPLAVGHAGFRFGGPLTTATLVLFLLVIVSGIWGLAMQQLLPQRLLNEFPTETIQSEVDTVMAYRTEEAAELVEGATGPGDPLRDLFDNEIAPYLRDGRRSRSLLRSASRASNIFSDQLNRHPAATPVIQKLQGLCDARRQYDAQVRIHWWLHNWLIVHLPLSVALCVVLVVHIVTALKYW